MRSTVVPIAALFYAASLISAQSPSSSCQTTLTGILASPDAACLNPSGLVPIFIGGTNTSIVGPINNWLAGVCSVGPCSNQTLAAIVTNVTSGCSAELKALGLGSGSASELTTVVQQFYPTVRKVLCLKDDSANQNCITQTLTNIEKTTGPLTLSKIFTGLANPFSIAPGGIPKEVICSNCVKAAYNIVAHDLGPAVNSSAASAECGPSFVDGQNPPGISQSAALGAASPSPSPSTSSKNTAMSSIVLSGGTVMGLAISLLFTVSSGFAFFA